MKNENYIVIPSRFIKELGLKGNELLVFSLIYGFSQDGESLFCGSIRFLQDTLNLSRETVRTVLKNLVEANLIIKIDKTVNGVKFCDYRTNIGGMQEISIPCKKLVRGIPESGMGGIPDSSPHNTSIYKLKDNILTSTEVDVCHEQVRDPEKKPPLDIKKFVQFFNDEMDKHESIIPRLKSLQGTRLNAINARIKEHGKDNLMLAVQKAAESDFLNGKNNRGWVATFSWIIKPNNFLKVIEGNYDNNMMNHENDKRNFEDRRRGFEVTATSAEDYSTTF